MNWSGLDDALARSFIGSVDVFDANIHSLEIARSTSLVMSLLTFGSSKTASIIRSASESAFKFVVGKIFDNILSFWSCDVLPNLMPLFRWFAAKFFHFLQIPAFDL
jgi:hypothetical protein